MMHGNIVIMAGKELYMVVSGCLVIQKTGKVHGADWHGKIVTFLLYGTVFTGTVAAFIHSACGGGKTEAFVIG